VILTPPDLLRSDLSYLKGQRSQLLLQDCVIASQLLDVDHGFLRLLFFFLFLLQPQRLFTYVWEVAFRVCFDVTQKVLFHRHAPQTLHETIPQTFSSDAIKLELVCFGLQLEHREGEFHYPFILPLFSSD
jgi:hypothetical protein